MATFLPQPTTAPSAYGLKSYAPMSSRTNQMASNYKAPSSVLGSSTQLNAFGAPIYSNNAWNTNNRIVKTNASTGAFLPQPGPAPSTPSAPSGGQDVINQNASDQNDVLNRDYEDTMTMLGNQEQQMLGQSAEASGTLSNEATQVNNQLANQQTVDTQGQEQQLAQGESTAATGLQGARDTFRQVQQNNIAQLSGAGLSSSSVAEALAEKLGVETARRIAGITGSLGEIRQNATKEMARIKSYYEGKATEATQWVANEKLKIQNALNSGLNQINLGRQQAASAKASARASLLSDVRTQLFTLQQQESQFQQSLKAWAVQKAASTEKLITDPASVLAYTKNINTLNANPGITQTNIGNYGVNDQGQTGYYAGPLKSVKKEDTMSGASMFGVQPDYQKFPNDGFTN